MQQHGVECIDCFAVDNVLIQPAGPSFVGYCHSQGSDCGEAAGRVLQTSPPKSRNSIVHCCMSVGQDDSRLLGTAHVSAVQLCKKSWVNLPGP